MNPLFICITSMLLAIATSSTATAQAIQPTKSDIDHIRHDGPHRSYPEEFIATWEIDLQSALKKGTLDQAADAIAAKYSLSNADMRRLAAAWTIAQARQYDQATEWKSALRADLYALLPSTRGSPIGLTIIAEALEAIDSCRKTDFEKMMAGSTDRARDAYLIAAATSCDGNFARATQAAGDRAMPVLFRFADWGSLPLGDTLAVYAWITSPQMLAHVDQRDRRAVTILLSQRYVSALLKVGLDRRALALLDAMPVDLRKATLSRTFVPPQTVRIDGITMTLDPGSGTVELSTLAAAEDFTTAVDALVDETTPSDKQKVSKTPAESRGRARHIYKSEAPVIETVEALAAAGREAEARALLHTLPDLLAAREAAACAFSDIDGKRKCAESRDLPMNALVVDHLLNGGDADPYPIAEAMLAGSSSDPITPAGAKILCRVFAPGQFPGVCTDATEGALSAAELKSDRSVSMSDEGDTLADSEVALTQAIPNFANLRKAMFDEGPPQPSATIGFARKTVEAPRALFVERPVPSEFQLMAKAFPQPKTASLPRGFVLVRSERKGMRVVAISQSQAYDPTGEVSGGGYWVHLSDDGGKSWQPPVYTGLSAHFPYVVSATSPMPMLTEDGLNLAVDVAEIDTATISYPPVGLKTRRRASGLYLEIPFSALKRDTDGDGFTDIAAHHLLLDRPKGVTGTPFVVGSDQGAACPDPSKERQALVSLLGKLVDPSGAAIVEPVDRPAGQVGFGWTRAGAPLDRPLFITGKASDYACLRAYRPIVIYDKEDIDELERFTPDFHTIEAPQIIFNRPRDRGYVKWSAGWAGVTYRLRFVDGKWVFNAISSWIS